jgi:hypothetical protein
MGLRASVSRRGEDIRPAPFSGFFPFAPALSLGERVNPTLSEYNPDPSALRYGMRAVPSP